jgi:leucyl-tRNA synthetase
MKKYDHKKIEKKWQKFWAEHKTFLSRNKSARPKKYVLVEFPYPSGEGLHMGHLRPYVAGDVTARYNRMRGFETMFPMGWDAFGLPAENYALKKGVHPSVSTVQNVKNAKKQLQNWGLSFDWSREINSTDPSYYKWTQWIFLQFYKAGLAYEATGLINWCPKDKTGLANEEVIDGRCERCGTPVVKKELRQWYLRITAYAEKLLEGLKHLPEWPEPVKLQQANWIGKSQGISWKQNIKDLNIPVECYDSVPQTFMAQTFCVIAPEHPLVEQLVKGTKYEKPVLEFVEAFKKRKGTDRFNIENEVEGIFTGRYIDNPFGTGDLPVWIATFVVADYGTGIVNASAHDERDFAFAKKFGIPLRPVMFPADPELARQVRNLEFCYHHDPEAVMEQPVQFKGRKWGEVREDIIDYVAKKGLGYRKVQYKLRDWVFSRQRYWGEPIPLIHCPNCGIVPVSEKDLPVKLPNVKKYEPTGTGESPLAVIDKWVNVKCPNCGGPAKRETNTMPQWAGSSWYFLRYPDPDNKKQFASPESLKRWLPVDIYFGGMEHTTLHLLYSRFWNLFLYDQQLVPVQEPYTKRVPHGIILGPDGEKMSKSRGNVVNPNDIVAQHGADTLRMYELFLGPHEATVLWDDKGIVGVRRFLDRVWLWVHAKAGAKETDSETVRRQLHKLIKKIGEDIETYHFNTAISAFMEFHNQVKDQPVSRNTLKIFLQLLYPFAPHISEELHQAVGGRKSVQLEAWPEYDAALTIDAMAQIVVQVNGKVKDKIFLPTGSAEAEVKSAALRSAKIHSALQGADIRRIVFVPNKLMNIVI